MIALVQGSQTVSRGGVRLGARWQALAPRERTLLALAAAVVGIALLYLLAVQPAWRVVRAAGAEHARLDAQLQRMQQLERQAQALQSSAAAPAAGSGAGTGAGLGAGASALQASVRQRLGDKARVQVGAERAEVALSGVAPESLAQWLQEARVNARSLPLQARLTRNAAGQWDGTLVMSLP
ncbi:MAG: type II secretion system protein GspM [Burkholderiaceae bacterium]